MTKKTNTEYEKLGKLLVSIGEAGAVNRKRLYRTAFIKGVFSGLGGVIGATILLALFIWVLSLLGDFPLIGRFAEKAQDTVRSR